MERDHRATLREAQARELATELDAVRSRYVRLSGREHRERMHRHHVREAVWLRFYWLAFLYQASLPGLVRRGPWRRFLDADRTKLDVARVLELMLPGRADAREHAMARSRRWLEPRS